MIYGAKSSVGCIRLNNQDSFHLPKKDGLPLFIVADGMGGTNGGEIASTLAISAICTFLEDNLTDGVDDIAPALRNAVNEANKTIYRVARMRQEYSRMGTTCTVALIKDGLAYIAHIGDSRAYINHNGVLRQITCDHSYVQELLNAGQITAQEAKEHPDKHKITKAVGVNGFVTADVFIEPFSDGDIILLCSDGLTNMIDDSCINEILCANEEPSKTVNKLVDAAEKAGGLDNITALIIKN